MVSLLLYHTFPNQNENLGIHEYFKPPPKILANIEQEIIFQEEKLRKFTSLDADRFLKVLVRVHVKVKKLRHA